MVFRSSVKSCNNQFFDFAQIFVFGINISAAFLINISLIRRIDDYSINFEFLIRRSLNFRLGTSRNYTNRHYCNCIYSIMRLHVTSSFGKMRLVQIV